MFLVASVVSEGNEQTASRCPLVRLKYPLCEVFYIETSPNPASQQYTVITAITTEDQESSMSESQLCRMTELNE